jgi:hypothetical protein
LDSPFIINLRQEFSERKEYYKADVDKWHDFIGEILNTSEVNRFGILLHFYTEGCEQEDIIIRDFKRANVNQVNPELLFKLEEDILYTFVK